MRGCGCGLLLGVILFKVVNEVWWWKVNNKFWWWVVDRLGMGIGCKDFCGFLLGVCGKKGKKRERVVVVLERLCGGMMLFDGEWLVFVCGRNGIFWKFFVFFLCCDLVYVWFFVGGCYFFLVLLISGLMIFLYCLEYL